MMHLHQRSGVAVCCSVLQCVAVYCSELQCVSLCCSVLQSTLIVYLHQRNIFQTATHSKLWASGALSRGASRCNTLQHTTTHSNTLRCTETHNITLQHTAARCSTLQHTATHCNTLQGLLGITIMATFLETNMFVAVCCSVLQCDAV